MVSASFWSHDHHTTIDTHQITTDRPHLSFLVSLFHIAIISHGFDTLDFYPDIISGISQ
jgi:hypothetical protein